MSKNNSFYSLLFAFLAGILFFIILWYLPGINVFVFYGTLGGLLLITFYTSDQKERFHNLGNAFLVVALFSLIPFYRTNLFYVSLIFLLLPVLFYMFFVIPKKDLKKVGLVHLILLPFIFVISWLYDLVIAIKNFSVSHAKQKLKESSSKQYLIGLLASIPFLIVFLILFSSADAVFNTYLKEFIDISSITDFIRDLFDDQEKLDLFGRVVVSGIFTVYFFAVYHAIFSSKSGWKTVNQKVDGVIKKIKPKWSPATLGTLLLPLNLLFGLFVIVQMRYLFGGEESIVGLDTLGYTFSEYARRGFIELIIVSFIVFFLIAILQSKVALKKVERTNWFKGNVVALLGLTFVIGLSALSRLQLLTSVYGLTNLRLFGLFVIVAILVLLPVTIRAVLRKKRVFWFNRNYAWAVLLTMLILTILPTDLIVARYNINRYEKTGEIDVPYLLTLSAEAQTYISDFLKSDAVPKSTQLVSAYYYAEAYELLQERDYPWASFNISRWRYEQKLEQNYNEIDVALNAVETHVSLLLKDYSEALMEGDYEKVYDQFWSLNTTKSDLIDFEKLDVQYIFYSPKFLDDQWLFNMLGFSMFDPHISMMVIPVDLELTIDDTNYRCDDQLLIFSLQNGEFVIAESDAFALGIPFYQDPSYYEGNLIEHPSDMMPSPQEPIPGQKWSYGCTEVDQF